MEDSDLDLEGLYYLLWNAVDVFTKGLDNLKVVLSVPSANMGNFSNLIMFIILYNGMIDGPFDSHHVMETIKKSPPKIKYKTPLNLQTCFANAPILCLLAKTERCLICWCLLESVTCQNARPSCTVRTRPATYSRGKQHSGR